MKNFVKISWSVVMVVILLLLAVVPSFADDVYTEGNPLDGCYVTVGGSVNNFINGSFRPVIWSYIPYTTSYSFDGIFFKQWAEDVLFNAIDPMSDYMSTLGLSIMFSKPMLLSDFDFFITDYDRALELTISLNSTNAGTLYADPELMPGTTYYAVSVQPTGSILDPTQIKINGISLSFRYNRDVTDPYDVYQAYYRTFCSIPFTICYNSGAYDMYKQGYHDGYDQGAEDKADELNEYYTSLIDVERAAFQHQLDLKDSEHRDAMIRLQLELDDYYAKLVEQQYKEGYDIGYKEGELVAKGPAREEGYREGYEAGQLVGFQNGFEKGSSADMNGDFATLLFNFFDAPVQAFSQLFDFDFLGVNLLSFLGAVLTLVVFVIVLMKVF